MSEAPSKLSRLNRTAAKSATDVELDRRVRILCGLAKRDSHEKLICTFCGKAHAASGHRLHLARYHRDVVLYLSAERFA